MSSHSAVLVVGGDSLVGSELVTTLENRGYKTYSSTRRRDNLTKKRVFVDFENSDSLQLPEDIDYAFIIAAATNYDRCVSDPQARIINVELIPDFVKKLLQRRIMVNFISSNAVFGGERAWPNEDEQHSPQIAYAQQKSLGEKEIKKFANALSAQDKLAITRLTKVLSVDTSPLPSWFKNISNGVNIEPFSDLIFAPISVQYVARSLASIYASRLSGNFHLSGADNINYVSFAECLIDRLDANPCLIAPTTSLLKKIHIDFKPKYSGLGMRRTKESLQLNPQNLVEVIDDLCSRYEQSI